MRWRVVLIVTFLTTAFALSHWPRDWQPFLEVVYGQHFYPLIQAGFGLFPGPKQFPLADLLWIALPMLFLLRVFLLLRRNLMRRAASILLEAGVWLSAGYLLILLLWGMNYHRPTLYDHLVNQGFTTQLKSGHWEFALEETRTTIASLPEDFDFCEATAFVPSSERSSAFAHSAMALADIPTAPHRSVKPSRWSWFYTRIAVGGVYIPFTGDPTFNAQSYPLSKPFTMTHEYGHWTGAATEYDADILAYWSLWLSPDPAWQYSAWLEWWAGISEPEPVRAQLPNELRESLTCLSEHLRNQPRWQIRRTFWRFYEANLKAQGISQGLKSYEMGESLALSSYQDWLFKKANRTLR